MIKFEDLESGDQAIVIVRKAGETIGLAVSLEDNADVEVFVTRDVALQIAEALSDVASSG